MLDAEATDPKGNQMVDEAFLRWSEVTKGKKWRVRQLRIGAEADHGPADTPEEVLASWQHGFSLEIGTKERPGLRRPQVGALHSLLAFWTTAPKLPATVVMPTGTGKTDTMIAAMVAGRISKLLVVVPSDALRDQLAESFAGLGIIRRIGLLDDNSRNPVVGTLNGGLENVADARDLADRCNVVVTTPNSLSASAPDARDALTVEFSHLFIDEAHHVTAPKWAEVREAFLPKPVVQFTATPFRRDGAHLGGVLVYAFPLREAQRDGYFSKIGYKPVLTAGDSDQAVAQVAVAQLREDLDNGYDHLLMARVDSIARARDILEIYRSIAPELSPQIAHSRTPKTELKDALAKLRAQPRVARILVCVDMFGEGFDFPELKVAALHDQHRSLAITMQFIGRFARVGKSLLGEATVVAARGEIRHIDPLRRLYAEDADWNLIVEDLSAAEIEGQQEETEFTRAFSEEPEAISIHSLTPAMSTVVYQPHGVNWHPERINDLFGEDRFVAGPSINRRDGVVWFVVSSETEVRWSSARAIEGLSLDLYIIYWDSSTGLLYIHSSNNDSVHEALARAVSGSPDATPIKGQGVYRVFAGVKRLTPTNIGLLDARSRSRRYTQYVGSDVTEAFPTTERQTKAQTHIAGTGFLDGVRYTIAGSLKGRVWSHRLARTVKEWTLWCDIVGPKLVDSSLNIDHVTDGFILPEAVDSWPDLRPLAIEWTHDFMIRMSDYELEVDGLRQPFSEVEVRLNGDVNGSNLPVQVESEKWTVNYALYFHAEGLRLVPENEDRDLQVIRTRVPVPFSSFVNNAVGGRIGLRVLLEGDGVIEPPGMLVKPRLDLEPYKRQSLRALDWSGVNLRAESWGVGRSEGTVQGRMVQEVLKAEWDVVLDDDGSGEVADIVALRLLDDRLEVLLVHCKYSHADEPGARVLDLYEVVGQAMRSAAWRRDLDAMIRKLIQRESRRVASSRPSGFIVGDHSALHRVWERSEALRPILEVAIAQPGLSARSASNSQLQLIASAESWVADTAGSQLRVYCSE